MRRRGARALKSALSFVIPLGVFFGLAEVFIRSFFPGRVTFPAPSKIFGTLGTVIDQGLLGNTALTLTRAGLGFMAATALGLLIGSLLGRNRLVRAMIGPVIDILRPLPSTAIAPVAMAVLGWGTESHYLLIILGGMWPVLITTASALQHFDEVADGVLRQYHINAFVRFLKFRLPSVAPQILSSMKVSLSICYILAVTAELVLPSTDGLGFLLKDYQNSAWYAAEYMVIATTAIAGYALNCIYNGIETALLSVRSGAAENSP